MQDEKIGEAIDESTMLLRALSPDSDFEVGAAGKEEKEEEAEEDLACYI